MFKRILLIAMTGIIALGCSSENHPIAPGGVSSDLQEPVLTRVTDITQNGRVVWAWFEWIVDTGEETFEAVPLRAGDLHLNVSKFIDGPPTLFAFTNFSVDKAASTVSLDVGITHPFPAKPNLAGFDVRGILIGSGNWTGFDDSSTVIAGPGDTRLLNSDGWTRWWNPVEFNIADNIFSYRDGTFGIKNEIGHYNCTVNGYKIFADDLTAGEHPDGLDLLNRAVFSPGATNTRHYIIWFPMQDDKFIFRFNYAVDACWEPIPGYVPGEPVTIPDDYPSEANQPEPFRTDLDAYFNNLYYISDEIKGGTLIYHVSVFDWQGYLETGNVADEISEVKIECPACFDTSFVGTLIDDGVDPQAYAVYEIVITGEHLIASTLNYDGLLSVVSANGDYQPSLTGYSGTALLSSYEVFPFADLITENIPPTAVATADPLSVYVGDPVYFDASGSTDEDGLIVSFEWDFDHDGVYGDPYDSGTDEQPVLSFGAIGTYLIDLMVTDNIGAPDILDPGELIEINVYDHSTENHAPVACAEAITPTTISVGGSVGFDATCSYDPDGDDITLRWDFDGDGTYGDLYEEGTDIQPIKYYNEIDTYQVDLMVTDPLLLTDFLDMPITVVVTDIPCDPPVACIEITSDPDDWWEDEPIEFDGGCSYDTNPDGEITQYLWDFDLDGIYGDPSDGGTAEQPLKAFGPGTHTIGLKVYNLCGVSATCESDPFFVESHVIITLPEDQDYKSANGYGYDAMWCDTGPDIPVDYTDLHGPWDFTGHDYLPDPDYMIIRLPSHAEVQPYVDLYPDTTQYFTRYDVHGAGVDGYLYMPEEADLINDILYVYGHIDRIMSEPEGAAAVYGPEQGGPMALQYPWSIFTDEHWVIEFTDGTIPLITIYYDEVGIGEGYATVPIDGGWTTRALLTRVLYKVEIGAQYAGQVLMYKWTADDGRQIARLYTLNTVSQTNFNEYTYEIIGLSRLTALSSEF